MQLVTVRARHQHGGRNYSPQSALPPARPPAGGRGGRVSRGRWGGGESPPPPLHSRICSPPEATGRRRAVRHHGNRSSLVRVKGGGRRPARCCRRGAHALIGGGGGVAAATTSSSSSSFFLPLAALLRPPQDGGPGCKQGRGWRRAGRQSGVRWERPRPSWRCSEGGTGCSALRAARLGRLLRQGRLGCGGRGLRRRCPV